MIILANDIRGWWRDVTWTLRIMWIDLHKEIRYDHILLFQQAFKYDFIYTSFFICCNLCFRARQHPRSLAPVMNDFWWFWWPIISGDGCGLRFPDICLTVEENPGKNFNQENWPDRGSNQAPRWEATVLPLDHSDGLFICYFPPPFNVGLTTQIPAVQMPAGRA